MITAAIDNPSQLSEVSDKFQVQGWVFSNSGLITLAKAICCGRKFRLRLGLALPNVLTPHPEICRNQFIGFECDLKVARPEEETGLKIAVLLEFEDPAVDRHELQIEMMPAEDSGATLRSTFQHGLDLPIQISSLAAYPDVAEQRMNSLVDFLTVGATEKRQPSDSSLVRFKLEKKCPGITNLAGLPNRSCLISNNLVTVEPSPEESAFGLETAVRLVSDHQARIGAVAFFWSRDWRLSFGPDFLDQVSNRVSPITSGSLVPL